MTTMPPGLSVTARRAAVTGIMTALSAVRPESLPGFPGRHPRLTSSVLTGLASAACIPLVTTHPAPRTLAGRAGLAAWAGVPIAVAQAFTYGLDRRVNEGLDTFFARHPRLATALLSGVFVWASTGDLPFDDTAPGDHLDDTAFEEGPLPERLVALLKLLAEALPDDLRTTVETQLDGLTSQVAEELADHLTQGPLTPAGGSPHLFPLSMTLPARLRWDSEGVTYELRIEVTDGLLAYLDLFPLSWEGPQDVWDADRLEMVPYPDPAQVKVVTDAELAAEL